MNSVQPEFGLIPPKVPFSVARLVPYSTDGLDKGLTFRPSGE